MDTGEIQTVRDARAQQQKVGIAGNGAQADEAAQRREAEEARRDVLATLLEPTARERCMWVISSPVVGRFTSSSHPTVPLCLIVSRIALVNSNLSTQIEALLLRLAQSGGIRGRVSDEQLVGLLDQVSDPGGFLVDCCLAALMSQGRIIAR